MDEEQERDAPVGVYSVLALVRERISQLRRVVRDEEDPVTLWASHNAVEDPAISGDFSGDIVLPSRASGRVPLIMWRFRAEDWETRKGAKKPKKSASKKPTKPVSKKPTPKKPVSKKPTPKAPAPKEAAPKVH